MVIYNLMLRDDMKSLTFAYFQEGKHFSDNEQHFQHVFEDFIAELSSNVDFVCRTYIDRLVHNINHTGCEAEYEHETVDSDRRNVLEEVHQVNQAEYYAHQGSNEIQYIVSDLILHVHSPDYVDQISKIVHENYSS